MNSRDPHGPAIVILAVGEEPSQRLSYALREGDSLRMGRMPGEGWSIPWDRSLSREQADMILRAGRLRVACLNTALNPIIYLGQKRREIQIELGEQFSIGGTVFRLATADWERTVAAGPETREVAGDETETSGDPAQVTMEQVYSAAEVRQMGFADAALQMEILAGLPHFISTSHSDPELARKLCSLLLEAIPQAKAVAVVDYDIGQLPAEGQSATVFPQPRLMCTDTRSDFRGRFQPSRRLIAKTLLSERSVVQSWGAGEASANFTMSEGLGWAFATPIPGDGCRGWCLYVSGRGTRSGAWEVRPEDLQADLRFTELVAQFIGAVRQVRLLQEHKTQLSAFFSPKVLESVTILRNRSSLTPAEREITVLFCDVRGFSRKSDELQDDLPRLLKSVSAALEVMAHGILDQDGTIADFQGDAALGFWGWPMPTEDGPLPACRAALAIWRQFRQAADDPHSLLHGFSVGMGIAHGRALAGQIGTAKQAKVGVFGPIVNRGARLEGMTKKFNVPICIDGATAKYACDHLPASEGWLRRLGRVLPMGMTTSVTATALIPGQHGAPESPRDVLEEYEHALALVDQGHWKRAAERLARCAPQDGPSTFLLSWLQSRDCAAPPDWDGLIALDSK